MAAVIIIVVAKNEISVGGCCYVVDNFNEVAVTGK
jgi:hypothetical protein